MDEHVRAVPEPVSQNVLRVQTSGEVNRVTEYPDVVTRRMGSERVRQANSFH